MRTSIKRLYEADDIQQMPMSDMAAQAAPQMPMMQQPPAPVQSPEEMMPNFSDTQEEPAQLPEADVMNLTVKELIDRCNEINPLVCMGLSQFIDQNKDQILSMTTGEAPEETEVDGEEDITFSKQMEPQEPEFSLDQSQIEFPEA